MRAEKALVEFTKDLGIEGILFPTFSCLNLSIFVLLKNAIVSFPEFSGPAASKIQVFKLLTLRFVHSMVWSSN